MELKLLNRLFGARDNLAQVEPCVDAAGEKPEIVLGLTLHRGASSPFGHQLVDLVPHAAALKKPTLPQKEMPHDGEPLQWTLVAAADQQRLEQFERYRAAIDIGHNAQNGLAAASGKLVHQILHTESVSDGHGVWFFFVR